MANKIQILEELPDGAEVNALGFPVVSVVERAYAEPEDAPVTMQEMLGAYILVPYDAGELWVKPPKANQQERMYLIARQTTEENSLATARHMLATFTYVCLGGRDGNSEIEMRQATAEELGEALEIDEVQALLNRYSGLSKPGKK